MSLTTWREEYMPDLVPNGKSWAAAVDYTLRKWRGLDAANLARHRIHSKAEVEMFTGYTRHTQGLYDDFGYTCYGERWVTMDEETCALPSLFCYKTTAMGCSECPLFISLGMACDSRGAPYATWLRGGETGPMLKALEECRIIAVQMDEEAVKLADASGKVGDA